MKIFRLPGPDMPSAAISGPLSRPEAARASGSLVYLVRLRRPNDECPTITAATVGGRLFDGRQAELYAFDPPPVGIARLAKLFYPSLRSAVLSPDFVAGLVGGQDYHDELARDLPFVAWHDELVLATPVTSKGRLASSCLGVTVPHLTQRESLQAIIEWQAHQAFLGSPAAYALAATIAGQLGRLHYHRHRFIVGEFNPNSVLVSGDRRHAHFIGAEHYQSAFHSATFKRPVPGYASPSARTAIAASIPVPLTAADDNFSLAVMIFRLIFDGGHPFQTGSRHPGMPTIDRNISARRFVCQDAAGFCALGRTCELYDRLPAALRDAFVKAFTTTTPPVADEWASLLRRYAPTE